MNRNYGISLFFAILFFLTYAAFVIVIKFNYPQFEIGVSIAGGLFLISLIIIIFVDKDDKDDKSPGYNQIKTNPLTNYLDTSIIIFSILYLFYIFNFFYVKVNIFTTISFYTFTALVGYSCLQILYIIFIKETKHLKELISILVLLGSIYGITILIKNNIPEYQNFVYNPNPYINPKVNKIDKYADNSLYM